MGLLSEYFEIVTDPSHALAEVTFTLLVDGLVLGVLWPLVRKAIRREHRAIDAEHGIEHSRELAPVGGSDRVP